MESDEGERRRKLWAYGSVYLFWGTTYLAIRVGIRQWPPFLMSAIRNLAAGSALLISARAKGSPWPTRRQWAHGLFLGFCFLTLGNGVTAWGLHFVDSGVATLMIAVIPIMTVVYGFFFQSKKISQAEGAVLGLGLAGVALLMSPGQLHAHEHAWWGIATLVWAALLWSVLISEIRRFDQAQSALMIPAVQMFGGAAGLFIFTLVLEKPLTMDWGALAPASWAAIAWLTVFGSCVGYLAFNWLLAHEPAQRVGTYSYVNPVVAVFFGWLILGEAITPQKLAAGALIITSVAGLLRLKPRA